MIILSGAVNPHTSSLLGRCEFKQAIGLLVNVGLTLEEELKLTGRARYHCHCVLLPCSNLEEGGQRRGYRDMIFMQQTLYNLTISWYNLKG